MADALADRKDVLIIGTGRNRKTDYRYCPKCHQYYILDFIGEEVTPIEETDIPGIKTDLPHATGHA